MRKDAAERATELLRKLVHVGSGFLALSFHWLTWPAALALALGGFAFNLLLLPRLTGRRLEREDERRRGLAFGILAYPLSVALLVLFFRRHLEIAAAGWALMAFGDGMASVVGSTWGRHPLPWNARKSWEGMAAFLLFGATAAIAISAFVSRAPQIWPLVAGIAVATCVTALAESAHSGIDDNIVVPLLGAGLVWLVADLAASDALAIHAQAGETVTRAAIALGLCAILAIVAVSRGMLTIAGAVGAAILGAVVAGFGDWPSFLFLCTFFALGVAATRVGRRVKEARGIAQERAGRRGLGNVIANGGLAGLLAIAAWPLRDPEDGVSLALACLVAALATAAFDTVSSEIGKAFGRRTVLLPTLRSVPPGTEGAVSLEGTLAGAVAAALVPLLPLTLLAWRAWLTSASGLLILGLAAMASAFVGSTFESIVGSSCHRRGHRIDNDFLNFANTVVGAATMIAIWPLVEKA